MLVLIQSLDWAIYSILQRMYILILVKVVIQKCYHTAYGKAAKCLSSSTMCSQYCTKRDDLECSTQLCVSDVKDFIQVSKQNLPLEWNGTSDSLIFQHYDKAERENVE
jgi:hypothetical protein